MNKWLRNISCITLSLWLSLSFSTTLGQAQFFDGIHKRLITYEEVDGYAVVEGDIIIASLDELKKKPAVVISRTSSRWPSGIVPYKLSPYLPNSTKSSIYQAIQHIEDKTNIDLIEVTSKNAKLYPNYIEFVPAGGSTCSSYVGRVGKNQPINLSPRCTTMNIVHEISHALGMFHEQSREDRDSYVRIAWENIDPSMRFNFEQHINDGTDFGEYDYGSLMHYGAVSFSRNGRATIIPLQSGVTIGQRVSLSEKDVAAINAMAANG